MFQEHHTISQDLSKTDPLITTLTNYGYFNVNADINLVPLPATQQLAAQLGQQFGYPSGSVSPHNGGPLSSYEGEVGVSGIGVAGYLTDLTATS